MNESNIPVTFINNPEPLDDKLYCICRQKWDGKLMIECELCDNWYHPECIGINEKDDIKLNLMYIICSLCRYSTQNDPNKSNPSGKADSSKNCGHQHKAIHAGHAGCHKFKKFSNMTSMDHLTPLHLPNQIEDLNISTELKPSNVINLSHSQQGNKFRLSLNYNGNAQEKVAFNEYVALSAHNRDFKIVEPFSEVEVKAKIPTTEDLAKTQIQRINQIYRNYYPTENDKKKFKKLLTMMVLDKKPLLTKREFEGNCLKGKKCYESMSDLQISLKKLKK